MKKNTSIIFILLGIFYGCAPKTIPTATDEKYEEDLSSTLPETDPYISPATGQSALARAEFKPPVTDITEELDTLLDSIAVVNKQIPYFQYTILVHIGNSRQAAEEARRDVFRVLPDSSPKMNFNPPSYRVKVGKFYSKLTAYQTLVKIKEIFPNAVIVPEQVYIE